MTRDVYDVKVETTEHGELKAKFAFLVHGQDLKSFVMRRNGWRMKIK